MHTKNSTPSQLDHNPIVFGTISPDVQMVLQQIRTPNMEIIIVRYYQKSTTKYINTIPELVQLIGCNPIVPDVQYIMISR